MELNMSKDAAVVRLLTTPPIAPGTRVGVWTDEVKSQDLLESISYLGEAVYEGDFLYGDTESQEPIRDLEYKLEILATTGRLVLPRLRFPSGKVLWGGSVSWDILTNAASLLSSVKNVKYSSPEEFAEAFDAFVEQATQFEELIQEHVNVYINTLDVIN